MGSPPRVGVQGVQAPLEKQKTYSSCLSTVPGCSDAKAALKHALENERKGEHLACTERKCIWIAEDYYKTKSLSGMPTPLSDELLKKNKDRGHLV
jgi:hypothetical protein